MQEVRRPGRKKTYTSEQEAKIIEMKDCSNNDIIDAVLLPYGTIWNIFKKHGLLEHRRGLGFKRGLAAMDKETRTRIARMGGLATSKDLAHMARIGTLGGLKVSRDIEHMRKIARRGGTAVAENREHMARIGAIGGRITQDKAKENQ